MPYQVLEHKYGFRAEDDGDRTPIESGNKIIYGDNLEALKSLLSKYGSDVKCIYLIKHGKNKIIIYQDDNEVTRVSVSFANEDLWLTQNQLAEIYGTTQQNITQHIANIYRDNELDEVTNKEFLLVQSEGA